MRVLLKNYGDVRIFTERPFVINDMWCNGDGTLEFLMVYGIEKKVTELVEQRIGSMNPPKGYMGQISQNPQLINMIDVYDPSLPDLLEIRWK